MKKIMTFILFIITFCCNAQISLENIYPTGNITDDFLRIVKLSTSGYKYYINDNSAITIYNMNHTIYKTINFPSFPGGLSSTAKANVFYLSETLFDLDSNNLEYFVYYRDVSNINHSIVYDELGNVLFSKDTTLLTVSNYFDVNFISYTDKGVKMIIYQSAEYPTLGKAFVYSLPGNMPCEVCHDGFMEIKKNKFESGSISNPFPNPANNQTTIEYNLPQGINKAEIVIYNMTGQEIKRYKVSNAFKNINISTNEISAGTYFFQIQASNGFIDSKKLIVVK